MRDSGLGESRREEEEERIERMKGKSG
jgi:hypothetical protein